MLEEIYRDSDLLAVAKPAGLLCVPGLCSPDNLFDRVKKRYPNARVVHRLDMATSGLVLFALHYDAQKALSWVFEKRRIRKRYSAIVAGCVEAASGHVCLPLLCDWEKRPRQKVCWQQGKSALTEFSVVSRDPGNQSTSIHLFPHTGRTHQLRVHMKALGHPIKGDRLYMEDEETQQPGRLMLHAEQLMFTQPMTGQDLTLTAPSPF